MRRARRSATAPDGPGRARFEPREVEQVRDQPLEPGHLEANRLEQLCAVALAQVERGALEPLAATRIAVRGERRSWLTACSTAVLTASLLRRVSASAAARALRRARVASSLTTTAVTTKTASATQFPESVSASVCSGGRKKKLNASMLKTETASA